MHGLQTQHGSFVPLGWGDWKSAVAAITGLVAKENVVGTLEFFGFAEVNGDNGIEMGTLAGAMTQAAAYSFLVFNLLCAPCFAAMGAIKREMNNAKWFWFAIGYQTLLAIRFLFVFIRWELLWRQVFSESEQRQRLH